MSDNSKTVALIAHDNKKETMIQFALDHRDVLARYNLIATGTTGRLIAERTGLPVTRMLSGPMGGDAQIAGQKGARFLRLFERVSQFLARLLGLPLTVPQRGVKAVLFDQFSMRALFDEATGFKHQNIVGVHDGR